MAKKEKDQVPEWVLKSVIGAYIVGLVVGFGLAIFVVLFYGVCT